ncbi:hypothetical protein DUI87_04721 [Hirundo rustica rustica]|uniref:Uncharacterized protein n=1 Tax=Hirundo rustica rustica TaxID=333673 RepID=A0A3M0L0A0_HIRRU|nr:hypothetical protein DUI87_04721 [Hirundo rustica rustica]
MGPRASTMDGRGSSFVWQCPGVEGGDGSDGCKGKEDLSPFCFNGKQIELADGWVLRLGLKTALALRKKLGSAGKQRMMAKEIWNFYLAGEPQAKWLSSWFELLGS